MHVCLGVGPSQVSEAVRADLAEIAASTLPSESHRGLVVKQVVRDAVSGLRAAMGIPADYAVVFQPSATAAMELILRNCVGRTSYHFVHGAFAARFAATAEQVGLAPQRCETAWEAVPDPAAARPPADTELIAVTHNETSTGQAWPIDALEALRARHPDALLAVDVTSSFGALAMDWRGADLWFGSVQKCLGLPAGLGFVLASPRALDVARARGAARGVAAWQDLPGMAARIESGETVETPNVLAVALLARQMARWDLARIEAETQQKALLVTEALGEARFFVPAPRWRSWTVHCVRVEDPQAWRRRAEAAGFVLGAGYGPLRETCVRLATFPSVPVADVARALDALT